MDVIMRVSLSFALKRASEACSIFVCKVASSLDDGLASASVQILQYVDAIDRGALKV